VKRRVILLIIFVIPVLLYLNVWQAFRYRVVETEIGLLEEQQQEWIEKNKKIIVGIEVLGAPSRVDTLAAEIEGLHRNNLPTAIRVKVGDSRGGNNG
jgi:hypothetical protein